MQNLETFTTVILGIGLFLLLLAPFLLYEIRSGKLVRRRGKPRGHGDVKEGTPTNPAPGQPDAQADPWKDPAAQPLVHESPRR